MTGPDCRRSSLVLAAVALWVGVVADAAAQGSAASDRAALEALYDATGGPNWIDNTNWKTAAPLGEWHGVTTDAFSGRVTSLWMHGNELTGAIPDAVGDLARLQELRLGARTIGQQYFLNALTGPIPPALGRLANLRRLDLNSNALTGSIPPALGQLANLQYLDLGGNALMGPIPAELGRLTNLERLNLTRNALTGPIPPTLGRLANLQRLGLDWNALTGSIPSALGRLANLRRLDLNSNALTGSIPPALGQLANLQYLDLGGNALTGPIPAELGRLTNLERLNLTRNALTGPIPATLQNLVNLRVLLLSYNWELSGPLPPVERFPRLRWALLMVTQVCAPADWLDRAATMTIELQGRPCGTGADVTIDVAVFHTPAARESAGGAAAIAAVIDLMVAETNQAYAASGVRHRLRLVERSEVAYNETGDSLVDVVRLALPSDGYMDEVHAVRDRVAADLVHLVVGESDVGGLAYRPGAYGLSVHSAGGLVFAHGLGHNMGLWDDRYEDRDRVRADPAYGYVNQQGLVEGAPESRRWRTIMASATQCADAGIDCPRLPRFSNPRQSHNGDPLGRPYGTGGTGVTGAADAVAVLDTTGPAVAAWRVGNRPPRATGRLPGRTLTPNATIDIDVSGAFIDPDGDTLTYTASSSAPHVVTVRATGSRLTLTAVGEGTAAIGVTAADPGDLSGARSFTVTVTASAPFTDGQIRPGVTPIKAVHFTELRIRIDALRVGAGLPRFPWTDPMLRVGVTLVKRVHLLELRTALAAAYAAEGRPEPGWTDVAPVPGATPIRAAHVTELRAAVLALE